MSEWLPRRLNPQLLSDAMCKEVRAKRITDLSLPPGRDRAFIIPRGAPVGNTCPALSADKAAWAGRAVVIYVTLPTC